VRGLARPRDRGAVERLGALAQVSAAAEDAPLLRQDDEAGTVVGRAADEPVGDLEVTGLVRRRRELDRGCA
jgi:hypothetical protein